MAVIGVYGRILRTRTNRIDVIWVGRRAGTWLTKTLFSWILRIDRWRRWPILGILTNWRRRRLSISRRHSSWAWGCRWRWRWSWAWSHKIRCFMECTRRIERSLKCSTTSGPGRIYRQHVRRDGQIGSSRAGPTFPYPPLAGS